MYSLLVTPIVGRDPLIDIELFDDENLVTILPDMTEEELVDLKKLVDLANETINTKALAKARWGAGLTPEEQGAEDNSKVDW